MSLGQAIFFPFSASEMPPPPGGPPQLPVILPISPPKYFSHFPAPLLSWSTSQRLSLGTCQQPPGCPLPPAPGLHTVAEVLSLEVSPLALPGAEGNAPQLPTAGAAQLSLPRPGGSQAGAALLEAGMWAWNPLCPQLQTHWLVT